MAVKERDKALTNEILAAMRLWAYDNDATVAAPKGEDRPTYGVQFDLVAHIVGAICKLDSSKSN